MDFLPTGSSLLLCEVCTKPTCKFNHNAAQVCRNCRSFFWRTIAKNKQENLICVSKGKRDSCILKRVENRKKPSCQFCQFHLCLRAGMNPNRRGAMQRRPLPNPLLVSPRVVTTNSDDEIIQRIVGKTEIIAKQDLIS